jgi:hypothetical protein
VTVLHGDCRQQLANLDASTVDACVTDPPYELGFMGKRWDSTGVAYDPTVWAEVLRVLKPGAFLLAFGGTRTYHRLTCAIEDAGFEVRDGIAAWLYGQGFPKGKGQLKPSWEPIVVARKPAPGPVLQIDACRVAMTTEDRDFILKTARPNTAGQEHVGDVMNRPSAPTVNVHQAGRWPANTVLAHHPDCGDDCHPDCWVRALDEQSGVSRSTSRPRRNTAAAHNRTSSMGKSSYDWTTGGHDDQGGASRYFPTFRYEAKGHHPRTAEGRRCSPPDREAARADALAGPPRHPARRPRARPVPRVRHHG